MPDVLTIREAVQRANADGLRISEYTLRRWVRTGAIPARKVGTKALLFYPNLVRHIQCQDGSDNAPTVENAISSIRRIGL